jgi:hypothetical protein
MIGNIFLAEIIPQGWLVSYPVALVDLTPRWK